MDNVDFVRKFNCGIELGDDGELPIDTSAASFDFLRGTQSRARGC